MFANHIGRIFMGVFTAIVLVLPLNLYAQSPLTVQPSTGRVGVGNTSPGYTLDVSGTVNAQYLRGDGSQLTNLPASGTSTAIDKVTANTTVVNTSAETNLYSFSVAGDTLSTNNVLRLTIQITDLDIGGLESCVLRFKYGGTTLGSLTITETTDLSKTNIKAMISFVIAADGATNAQVGTAFFHASSAFGSPILGQGTSALDSTAAQTLAVTADWSSATNANSITLGQAVLEKL
jgi:hypothetical protein